MAPQWKGPYVGLPLNFKNKVYPLLQEFLLPFPFFNQNHKSADR